MNPCRTAISLLAQTTHPTSSLDRLGLSDVWADNHLRNFLFLLGAIFLGLLIGKIAAYSIRRAATTLEHHRWHAQSILIGGLASPTSLAIFAVALWLGLSQLALSTLLEIARDKAAFFLITIAVFWYGFNLVSVVELVLQKFTRRTASTLDDQLLPIVRKTLRIFLVVLGALFVLQNVFERDVGAWLAGLGIAGLAVSLAAQDSLKHLFGSITILLDRPFQIGQRIMFQQYDGVVEEIGFRSTKLRLFTGHLVTIPNGTLVNDTVENAGVRPFIRRVLDVGVTYGTPPEKIREAIAIVRNLLLSDSMRPHIVGPAGEDPPQVFFDEFKPSSLNIKVYYWYRGNDWWGYLDFTQRFNLALISAFNHAGINFAFPTQTIHVARTGRSVDRSQTITSVL
jgi:MscS family membrane protein